MSSRRGSTSANPVADPPRRARRFREPRRPTGLPWSLRVGVPLVVLATILAWSYFEWQQSQTWLRLTAPGPVDGPILVELFEFDERGSAAAPPPRRGEVEGALGWNRLPGSLVGPRALARISAPGSGTTYAAVEPGSAHDVELGPPVPIEGLVRANGLPIAGADVMAWTPGPPYVPITSTTTDESGLFRLPGAAASTEYLRIRVLHAGFRAAYATVAMRSLEGAAIDLEATLPVAGRVELPEGLTAGGLEVRVYNVPGVATTCSADGSFRLDHLPPSPLHCRLLVAGLGAGWTHRQARVQAGMQEVRIRIEPASELAGTVIHALTGAAVANASVLHEHGPHGDEVVRTDDYGRFRIGRVPPGPVELQADSMLALPRRPGRPADSPRMLHRSGRLVLDLAPGERREEVVIRIE